MPHPGFLLAEDAALKRRLSQIAVVDDRNQERLVDVFFRYPENATEKSYPFITIDLLDIEHNTEVQTSETNYYYASDVTGMSPDQIARYQEFNYYPSTLGPAQMEALAEDGRFLSTESFVPVNLLYQVTTYTRSQSHDRQITATMLRRVTPFRRGFIEVPEDGTMRRLDLLNWNPTNVLDQEAAYTKRIFRKVYTLRMNAEIPASDLVGINRVLTVEGTLNVENQNALSVNNTPVLVEEF
jgi:hypothetical protein